MTKANRLSIALCARQAILGWAINSGSANRGSNLRPGATSTYGSRRRPDSQILCFDTPPRSVLAAVLVGQHFGSTRRAQLRHTGDTVFRVARGHSPGTRTAQVVDTPLA